MGPILSTASFRLPTEPFPTEGPMDWVRVQRIRKANGCRPFFLVHSFLCGLWRGRNIPEVCVDARRRATTKSTNPCRHSRRRKNSRPRRGYPLLADLSYLRRAQSARQSHFAQFFILPLLPERLGLPAGTADLPQNSIAQRYDPKALEVFTKTGVHLKYPLLPLDAWPKIVAYYLHESPGQALPQAKKDRVWQSLPQFEVFRPDCRTPMPFTTLIAKIRKKDGFTQVIQPKIRWRCFCRSPSIFAPKRLGLLRLAQFILPTTRRAN